VEASRMDGDNFRRNLVTILAEQSCAPAWRCTRLPRCGWCL
jgi:hypothetical protein